jgi:hypothetical protein
VLPLLPFLVGFTVLFTGFLNLCYGLLCRQMSKLIGADSRIAYSTRSE